MNPEWVYYFLSGNDQNGAPVIVVFAVNSRRDVVYIMPYAKIHPTSMPLAEVPMLPTKLGRIVTFTTMQCDRKQARVAWEMLCADTQYNMKPTTFHEHYPNKSFDQVKDRPKLDMFDYHQSDRIYSNTNYALEA